MSADHVTEIRRSLVDPVKLAEALSLTRGAKRQASGLLVCCPVHGDRTPSLSITRGPDGTIRCKCFGCDWTGDALALIAQVHGLSPRGQFREVLQAGAQIAGLLTVLDELSGAKPYEPRALPPAPAPVSEREYPPLGEVAKLWNGCGRVDQDRVVSDHLTRRGLDPDAVANRGLARALTASQHLPEWARYGERDWRRSGHRMLLPVYDSSGDVRSVRAWRVEGDCPAKRLPPGGYKASGLVLASRTAASLIRETDALKRLPGRLAVVEGEPDFLSACLRWPSLAVLGVLNGSWTAELAGRIPRGSQVLVMTHHDPAGGKYAEQIRASLGERAIVTRSQA